MSSIENIKKLCSFCVSDWHFITMITPYIHEKIAKGENVKIYTEKDMSNLVKIFLSKLTLKEEIKKDISKLNWKEKLIGNELENIRDKNITLIINGDNEYIESINDYIENVFKDKNDKKLTIIDIYDVSQFKQNVYEILSKHDKVLNTSGEKEIEEVFEDFNIKKEKSV